MPCRTAASRASAAGDTASTTVLSPTRAPPSAWIRSRPCRTAWATRSVDQGSLPSPPYNARKKVPNTAPEVPPARTKYEVDRASSTSASVPRSGSS
ncbi:Uncharacterised protein [Mycobacteroides abscessus subsp. abscessus]|nr:Uncharacterised protein [Mycobacteroides abscessus subsp. abscessus]